MGMHALSNRLPEMRCCYEQGFIPSEPATPQVISIECAKESDARQGNFLPIEEVEINEHCVYVIRVTLWSPNAQIDGRLFGDAFCCREQQVVVDMKQRGELQDCRPLDDRLRDRWEGLPVETRTEGGESLASTGPASCLH